MRGRRSIGVGTSAVARADLDSGRGDRRPVDVLVRHRIFVGTIRTGHPTGPYPPAGRVDDHYFHRANPRGGSGSAVTRSAGRR